MAEPRSLLSPYVLSAALLSLGLAPEIVPGRLADVLRRNGKNRVDLERMERNYYEHLLGTGRRLDTAIVTPPPPPFKDGPLAMAVDDIRECVLVPRLSTIHQNARWTTNVLGLRDRDYDREMPAGTRRIVLIGDSIGVGWGVDDGLAFEPRLERSLDARSRSAGGPGIEILNLCVPGYSPGQRRSHLERLGWSLDPDLVLYQATEADIAWDERRLRALLPRGIGWAEPMYQAVLESSGVRPGDGPDEIKDHLKPRRWQILESVYQSLIDDARGRGVPIAWVLLPRVGRSIDPADRRRLVAMAHRLGFDPVIDLTGAFDGLDPDDLAIGPNDYHPNAKGHARLARRLETALADWPGAPWNHPRPREPDRPRTAGGGGPRR